MKRLFIVLALAVLAAAPAAAQVAAPTLTPAVPSVFGAGVVPSNPAVAPWGDGSRVVFGAIKDKSVDTALPGLNKDTTTLDGMYAGALLVGSMGAFGVDYLSVDGSVDDGVTTQENRSTSVALAFPIGDVLSLGALRRSVNRKVDTVILGQPAIFDVTLEETSVGLTVRLGGVFYIGATGGNEDVNLDLTALGTTTTMALTRGVQSAGIGLRTEGSTRWHLEYTTSKRESKVDPVTLNSVVGEEQSTVVVELLAGGAWLLAVAATDGEIIPGGAGTRSQQDIKRVALGYTPRPGWGLFLVRSDLKTEDPTSIVEQTTDTLSFTYAF